VRRGRLRGSDLEGGGIGSEGFREKLELNGGASERAATVFGTKVSGLAGGSKGLSSRSSLKT